MAETNRIRVRLVTPERVLFDKEADTVDLPSRSGYLEVLRGHAPLLAELGAGDVIIHGAGSGDDRFNVSWGFVEVLPERVTILANHALRPDEIDTAKAQKELADAQKEWSEAGDDAAQYEDANRRIAEANSRLESSGEAKP